MSTIHNKHVTLSDVSNLFTTQIADAVARITGESARIYDHGKTTYIAHPQDTIQVVWSIDDIIKHARENANHYRVPRKPEARRILAYIKLHHDCNEGISWRTIADQLETK